MSWRLLATIIVLSFILFLALNIKIPIRIEGDGVFYYSWLHSAVMDHDFDFKNQLDHFASYDFYSLKFAKENIVTPTGLRPNPYAYGVAIMWLPFFLLGAAATWLGHFFNPTFFVPDGYSYFYILFINFGTWLYGTAALIVIYKILNRFFNKNHAALATAAIFLATPWFYYQFFEPSMAHIASLFLVSAFIYLVIKKSTGERVNNFLLAGIIFLTIATRWQNAIFLLLYLPIVFPPSLRRRGLGGGYESNEFNRRPQNLTQPLLGKERGRYDWLILFLPVLIFIIIQFFIWHYLYGQYFLIPQGQYFIRSEWHGFYILFSSDRGLLLWSPILILAFIGWPYLYQKSKPLAWLALIIFVCQWVLNSSLNDLGGGDAFGARRFIETLPFFALALAAFVEKYKKFFWLLMIAVFIFVGINFLMIVNYRAGILPHAGQFNFFNLFSATGGSALGGKF